MGKFVYSPEYSKVDLGPHVFPTIKYRLIYKKLITYKLAKKSDFIDPGEASDEEILLVHTNDYLQKWKRGSLSPYDRAKLELPYSPQLFKSSLGAVAGTILASKMALGEGLGIHIGGGFHHAFPDHGEGFCVFNDIACAIRKLQKEKMVKKVLVIDCDLHQGNGTAFIFQGDRSVFTFSIHQEDLYPWPKEKSDLDIGLDLGTSDKEYLAELRQHIPPIIKKFRPDLIIYVAGADPYKEDRLGNLGLTIKGLEKRDNFVISQARNREISIAIVLAGGYSEKISDLVEIHTNTIKSALRNFNSNP